MAKENSTDAGDKAPELAPFMTSYDDGYLMRDEGAPPIMMIHPDATSIDLWKVAQARIDGLHKLLSMVGCTGETEVSFDIAEMAEVILPRVEEIRILADEANKRIRNAKKAQVTKLASVVRATEFRV